MDERVHYLTCEAKYHWKTVFASKTRATTKLLIRHTLQAPIRALKVYGLRNSGKQIPEVHQLRVVEKRNSSLEKMSHRIRRLRPDPKMLPPDHVRGAARYALLFGMAKVVSVRQPFRALHGGEVFCSIAQKGLTSCLPLPRHRRRPAARVESEHLHHCDFALAFSEFCADPRRTQDLALPLSIGFSAHTIW